MNLDCCWKIRRAVNEVMRIAETCLNTSIYVGHFCPPAEEGLISVKQVYATRSGEPMCHDAVRKSRAKELKHMQDHSVFEVVWLSEVKSLSRRCDPSGCKT